jgi:diguanylate cyclase (GGDEF)-like protein
MYLINNYRVVAKYNRNVNDESYVAESLHSAGDLKFVKIKNKHLDKCLLEDYIANFPKYIGIKHKNLLDTYEFDVVKTIDLKLINAPLYLISSEYCNWKRMSEIGELTIKEYAQIIIKVLEIVDFLHFRGFCIKVLNPDIIFISDDLDVKLLNISSIIDLQYNYQNYEDYFEYIAPEVLSESKEVTLRSDYYSLGCLIKNYLLSRVDDNDNNYILLKNYVDKLTNSNPLNREITILELINSIKTMFNIDYLIDYVKERGYLNFDSSIVGLENYIKIYYDIDFNLQNNVLMERSIIYSGKKGTGKSILLNEWVRLSRLNFRDSIYFDFSSYDPLNNNLNDLIIKLLDSQDILHDFVSVNNTIKISREKGFDAYNLEKANERHTVFSILVEAIIKRYKNRVLYIIINDLDNIGKEALELIDYLIVRLKEQKVFFVFSSSESSTFTDFNNYVDYWIDNKFMIKFKLSNLDKENAKKFVQKILGIGYPPYAFAEKIYKESKGNPRYIEILLRYLYDSNIIYMNNNGNWALRVDNYDDLIFPKNVGERFKIILDSLSKEEIDLLYLVSCIDGNIYIDYLEALNENISEVNKILDSLLKKRILYLVHSNDVELIEFVDEELKWALYSALDQNKKDQIHIKISNLIINKKNTGKNFNFLELMHQLSCSSQLDLLINFVYEKREEENNKYSDSFIKILELCYSMIQNKDAIKELEVLITLVDTYNTRGEYKKSKKIIDKINSSSYLSEEMSINTATILNILLLEIYIRTDKSHMATILLEEIEPHLNEIDAENLMRFYYIKSVYYMGIGENENAKIIANYAIELSLKSNVNRYLADLYNIRGICEFTEGNSNEAIHDYERSIEYFNNSDRPFDVVKPLNNIANEYGDNYGRIDVAIEYYLKCIDILKEYRLNNKIGNFLNNLAESYITTRDYEKAEYYLEEAFKICQQTKDRSLYYYAKINAGFVMLYTKKLNKAYDIYEDLRQMNKLQPILDKEILVNYSEFLSLFYYEFGNIEMATKFCDISMQRSKNISIKIFSRARVRKFYLDIITNNKFDKLSAINMIEEFSEKANKYDLADFILEMAFFALYFGELDFFDELLIQYKKIDQIKVTDKFNHDFLILKKIGRVKSANQFDILNLIIEKQNDFLLPTILYFILVAKFSHASRNHIASLKSSLFILDFLSKATSGLENGDFKKYVYELYKTDKVVETINDVLKNEFSIEQDSLAIKLIHEDINQFISCLPDEIFEKIFYTTEATRKFATIETLLSNFTDKNEDNLSLVMRYIATITNAERVFVKIFANEDNREDEFISYNNKMIIDKSNSMIENYILQGNEIFYNRNMNVNLEAIYEQYIDNNVQALIAIPLFNDLSGQVRKYEKRKYSNPQNKKILGYLYIESRSKLNRIDNARYYSIKGISNILYLTIQNKMLFIKTNIDILTKAYTRDKVMDIAEDLISEYNNINIEFALLMIDIDKFKNVNDTYGHQFGDEVLKKIVEISKKNVRDTDIVGRYGGEEFLILLQGVDSHNALNVAEKIRKSIEEYVFPKNNNSVTISIGISHFPTNGYLLDDLIFKADQALYFAKEVKGRNSVVNWNEEIVEIKDLKNFNLEVNIDNIFQDFETITNILETSKLYKTNKNLEEKISVYLTKLIAGTDADYASLVLFIDDEIKKYAKLKENDKLVKNVLIDEDIIYRVRSNKRIESFINWDKDILNNGRFDKKIYSVLSVPIIIKDEVKAVAYLKASLKNKEFDKRDIYYVDLISGIFSGNILIN